MDKLFSLRTEIEGQQVCVQVYPDSDLLEVSKEMCAKHGLDTSCRQLIVQLIINQLKQRLESEDEALEWKYRLSCVLERMLDKYDEAQASTSQHAQYFKSQAKRTRKPQPNRRPPEKQVDLYDKAMKLQQKRQLMHQQNKLQQQSKELESCTFQPCINSSSTNSFRKRRLKQQNIYDALYKEARSIEGKKDKRRIQLIQEQPTSTFTPQLNECSLRIIEVKGKEGVERRTPKNAPRPEEYPFKPTISEESKRIAKQFPNFWEKVEREATTASQKQCKQQPPRNRSTTGQENRDPQLNPKSLEILELKKRNLFLFLFEQLQTDGCVDAESIHQNRCLVQGDQFEIMLPLLEEIKALDVNLDKQEFLQSMEVLYATLRPQSKSRLIGHNIRAKWEEEHESYRNQFSFHPKISQPPNKVKVRNPTFQHTADALFYAGCEVIQEEAETSESSCRAERSTIDM